MSGPFSVFAAALETPHAPGLLVDDRKYTYAELADLVTARIPQLDASPFPLVADNTLETAITLYALLEARIPALLLHPKLTPAERDERLTAAQDASLLAYPDALAILYTSGTTGIARGAVLSRASFLASAEASATNLGWEPGDRWLACMPLAHIGGLSILIRSVAARQCAALASRFDARLLPEWIESRRITLLSLVPTMLKKRARCASALDPAAASALRAAGRCSRISQAARRSPASAGTRRGDIRHDGSLLASDGNVLPGSLRRAGGPCRRFASQRVSPNRPRPDSNPRPVRYVRLLEPAGPARRRMVRYRRPGRDRLCRSPAHPCPPYGSHRHRW